MSINIMDRLDQHTNSDPNTNYEILIDEIENAREKYKHEKSTWIIQGIIRSIKTRDRLCKKNKNDRP